jgi:hypothetical protein
MTFVGRARTAFHDRHPVQTPRRRHGTIWARAAIPATSPRAGAAPAARPAEARGPATHPLAPAPRHRRVVQPGGTPTQRGGTRGHDTIWARATIPATSPRAGAAPPARTLAARGPATHPLAPALRHRRVGRARPDPRAARPSADSPLATHPMAGARPPAGALQAPACWAIRRPGVRV